MPRSHVMEMLFIDDFVIWIYDVVVGFYWGAHLTAERYRHIARTDFNITNFFRVCTDRVGLVFNKESLGSWMFLFTSF